MGLQPPKKSPAKRMLEFGFGCCVLRGQYLAASRSDFTNSFIALDFVSKGSFYFLGPTEFRAKPVTLGPPRGSSDSTF
jgi:hypothetical protein